MFKRLLPGLVLCLLCSGENAPTPSIPVPIPVYSGRMGKAIIPNPCVNEHRLLAGKVKLRLGVPLPPYVQQLEISACAADGANSQLLGRWIPDKSDNKEGEGSATEADGAACLAAPLVTILTRSTHLQVGIRIGGKGMHVPMPPIHLEVVGAQKPEGDQTYELRKVAWEQAVSALRHHMDQMAETQQKFADTHDEFETIQEDPEPDSSLRKTLEQRKTQLLRDMKAEQRKQKVLQAAQDAAEQAKEQAAKDAKAWQGALTLKVIPNPVGTETRHFHVELYAGGALLKTRQDFSKTFPELMLVGSARTSEWDPWFLEARLESGLTASAAKKITFPGISTPPPESTEPPPPETIGTRSFSTQISVGAGQRWYLHNFSGWLKAVSLQVFTSFGYVTLPDDGILGGSYNQTLTGLKFRNEGGHFSGAYLSVGYGRSEQFRNAPSLPHPSSSRYVSRRFKTDCFVPLTSQEHSVRLALRIQTDMPDDPWTSASGNLPAETRISLLMPIDIRQLTEWIMGK